MTPELNYLVGALVLAFVQLIAVASIFSLTNGLPYGMSSRDTPPPRPMPLVGGRLERAFKNLMETLPMAIGAILIAHLANRHNAYTVWGATLYFWGRLAYVLVYAAGIPVLRTLVWFAATLGILLVLLGLAWR